MKNNSVLRVVLVVGGMLLFMFPAFPAKAKLAIQMEQKIISVSRIGFEENMLTEEGETFSLRDEEMENKVRAYIGKKARVLYFKIAQEQVCVDIAPVTAQPFEIKPRLKPKGNGQARPL
jgi:hypothetical protein